MCTRVSDVILVPSTNIHSSSRENGSCCGRSVMSCERSIAFAPASHAAFNWASLESSSHCMRSSWFASTWINSRWKERPLQLTSIIFSTSECLHLVGMQYGGNSAVRPRAPKQSENIFTRPASPGETVFTASAADVLPSDPAIPLRRHWLLWIPWGTSLPTSPGALCTPG